MRRIRSMAEARPAETVPDDAGGAEDSPGGDPGDVPAFPARPDGPFDTSEQSRDAEQPRLDVGCLLITGQPAVEIRLELDQQRQAVIAVTFVHGRGSAQVQVFAAPRSRATWPEVAEALRAQITQAGGQVSTEVGPFGDELSTVVRSPDGGTQPARLIGINGPRWLVRVTYLGAAAPVGGSPLLEQMVRDLIIVRGTQPLAPGEQVPFRPPAALTAGA